MKATTFDDGAMAVFYAATQDFVVTAKVMGEQHKAGHETSGKPRYDSQPLMA
jgi:hypothetical protein